MKKRIAWKIIMAGSDSNHREGTKQKARKRAFGRLSETGLFTPAEYSDLVRGKIREGAR